MALLQIAKIDGLVLLQFEPDPARCYVIGRGDGAQILLRAASVSRRHAILFHHAGRWHVSDLGSRNGVRDPSGERPDAILGSDSWVSVGPAYFWLLDDGGDAGVPPSTDVESLETVPAGVHLRTELIAGRAEPGSHERSDAASAAGGSSNVGLLFSDAEGRAQRIVRPAGRHPLVLGRDPACDVVLGDPSISRLHAIVFADDDGWSIADAGDSSGIFEEGERVRMARLGGSKTVRLGTMSIQLVSIAAAPAPTFTRDATDGSAMHLAESDDFDDVDLTDGLESSAAPSRPGRR